MPPSPPTTPGRLILASGSPQRRKLLADAGYRFEVIAPQIVEEQGACSQCGPAELVSILALRKAAAVVQGEPRQRLNEQQVDDSVTVIGCDTVAECGGEILGKPQNDEHARKMLERLSGQSHRVYSGLCIWSVSIGVPATRVAVTHLQMDRLTEEAIDTYLQTDLWQGKAGAFGYQDGPDWLHLEQGSESNVVGLPLELLAEMLRVIEAPERP
jgi:septum formation protein